MKRARLDRALCNMEWRTRFQKGEKKINRIEGPKDSRDEWCRNPNQVVTKEKERGGLGLGSMALLMKLGWRLATEPMELGARVMKGKYCKGGDLEEPMHARSSSNAWCGIIETRELTKKGMGHAIVDRREAKFWLDKWSDGKELASYAIQEIPNDQRQCSVRDYWSHNAGWAWERLSCYLPDDFLQRIASFELVQEEVGDG
ncbi:hypothetical protein Cgig2_016993 [Carnegiea gigantea]|uniref:Uncharacterized protein n=1 Tax=Carnegiea gigantea TaxID=171969 RepID=A0A9Q1KHB2_9CARY|nr:hypothetical protein Cgig2_016993 [Carnegiea gigantea]